MSKQLHTRPLSKSMWTSTMNLFIRKNKIHAISNSNSIQSKHFIQNNRIRRRLHCAWFSFHVLDSLFCYRFLRFSASSKVVTYLDQLNLTSSAKSYCHQCHGATPFLFCAGSNMSKEVVSPRHFAIRCRGRDVAGDPSGIRSESFSPFVAIATCPDLLSFGRMHLLVHQGQHTTALHRVVSILG